ncbi:hypothetical protein NDN08_001573 [Rhodosorus marinus]|uniref:Calmodulin n=1 Tax=Rhodosorus marinus TaxID=101924 RepID=A0AAV8UVF4_9RHOD|nr:hypothetical protein NDN08_001573 [Rhodosorus marinus]
MEKGTEEESKQEKPAEVQLPRSVDSGDIVLFNRRCTSMTAYGAAICIVAKFFSNSKWDHVGIVVRDPDSKKLFFLEADLGGVKLRKLSDRVSKSKSHDIAVRRLSAMRTDEFRRQLWNFAQQMTGRPYETGTGLLQAAQAVFDPLTKQERERLHALLIEKKEQLTDIQRELDNAVLTTYQRRVLLAERTRVSRNVEVLSARLNEVIESERPVSTKRMRREDDLARVFCSELVAASYQRLKLLEPYPKADSYTPRDFCSDPAASLKLLDRNRLSRELYLRRDGTIVSDNSDGSRKNVETGQTPSKESLSVLRKVLKRSPIAYEIPDLYKRLEFLKSFRSVVVDPGDVIFEQGEYGNQLYILESGAVDRFITKDNGPPILVSSLGPHTSFGMTAFMYPTPRTSTIRATERSVLWTVDRPTFENYRDEREASQILSSAEQRQLRKTLEEHFLFRSLDRIGPSELNLFFKLKFRAGEEIFHQGDAHDNFYILSKGECERHISHPKSKGSSDDRQGEGSGSLAKTIFPGESFGELGLMYNSRRSATIRARTDVECWAINAEGFHRLHLGGGARYLQAVFQKNASVKRDGKLYATPEDFLKFANVDTFPEEDRERLSRLLISLVTSNRKADESDNGKVLIDFWEFVRFDIVLNQPNAEAEFGFRLADRNNSGFIDAEELMSLLNEYKDIDEEAGKMLSSFQFLSNLFGRDGSHAISYKEYCKLPLGSILPGQFRRDVHFLAEHMLYHLEPAVAHDEDESHDYVDVVNGYLYKTEGEQPKNTIKQHLDLLHLLAVGISGALARTFVAPLERLKILMQTDSLTGHKKFTNLWKGMKTMVQRETSLMGLFRGNAANVIRIVPTAIIQLSAVFLIREKLGYNDELRKQSVQSKEFKPSSGSTKIAIAGVSGLCAGIALYPLEFIRGRLSVQSASHCPYNGILHGLRSSIRQTGLLSVYRGLTPSLLGVFPYVGISYATYDQLRQFFPKLQDGSGLPTPTSAVICGSVGSLTAQTLAYPLDTCRRRMQVHGFLDGIGQQGDKGPRMAHVVREIYQTQGLLGFYRGVVPNALKVVPSTIIAYYMYDFVRTRLIIERSLWFKSEAGHGDETLTAFTAKSISETTDRSRL